jgi:hypothetical protein
VFADENMSSAKLGARPDVIVFARLIEVIAFVLERGGPVNDDTRLLVDRIVVLCNGP